jgi:hypothetical protein
VTITASDLYANLGAAEDALTAARRAVTELERAYHRLDTPDPGPLTATQTALAHARDALQAAAIHLGIAHAHARPTPAS